MQQVTGTSTAQPPLTILGAAYGPVCKTDHVRSLVTGNTLNVAANNDTFGDTWPHLKKSLVVVYEYESHPQVAVVKEGESMSVCFRGVGSSCPTTSKFGILGAAYGAGDVTVKANSLIANDKLEIAVDNSNFPDTWHGEKKTFAAVFKNGTSNPFMVIAIEGQYISVSAQ